LLGYANFSPVLMPSWGGKELGKISTQE
jgi:hypothetical protein